MTLKDLNEFAKEQGLTEDVHIMISMESVFSPDPETLEKNKWNGSEYICISE